MLDTLTPLQGELTFMIQVVCASNNSNWDIPGILFNWSLFYSQMGAIDRSQDILMQIDHTRLNDCESLYTPEKLVRHNHPEECTVTYNRISNIYKTALYFQVLITNMCFFIVMLGLIYPWFEFRASCGSLQTLYQITCLHCWSYRSLWIRVLLEPPTPQLRMKLTKYQDSMKTCRGINSH